jgi:predicted transcriptional regulator YdeE
MQSSREQLPAIQLIGITTRTNNRQEMDPTTAKIGKTVQHYMEAGLADTIPARVKPCTTFCVYTDYESDYTGDYTYFIGEMVSSLDKVPEGLKPLTIAAHAYTKFTTAPGPMPNVCIQAWQTIWQMTPEQLGGKRSYVADFEIYDERAADFEKTVLDIYIGINP